LARETAAFYRTMPSYSRLQDMEGLNEPAELHLIGTWDRILDGLQEYADAGVTDFRLEIAAANADDRTASREAFTSYFRDVPEPLVLRNEAPRRDAAVLASQAGLARCQRTNVDPPDLSTRRAVRDEHETQGPRLRAQCNERADLMNDGSHGEVVGVSAGLGEERGGAIGFAAADERPAPPVSCAGGEGE
jgi:hypothetical protein